MDRQQLIIFQKVAQLNNMSKAAEELHISQPAISKSITNMEKELSLELFARRGKTISLNDNGRQILHYVGTILSEFDKIYCFASQNRKTESVHILAMAADQLLPEIVFRLNKANSDINIQVSHYQSGDKSPDIIITSSLKPFDGENGLTVLKEDFVLILPAKHPLSRRAEIKLSDLQGQPMVFLSKGIPLREIMLYWLEQAGVTPAFSYECDSCVMMREIINSGKGIGLVPSKTWAFPYGKDICVVPISDRVCYRYVNVICNADAESKAVRKVYQYIVSYFGKMNARN